MKKYTILIIILVIVVLAVAYFLQKEQPESPSTFECVTDNDCKLIYSNCDCEAVLISDLRTSLESNEICKWNICYGTNVTAICRNNRCVRSDQ